MLKNIILSDVEQLALFILAEKTVSVV